MTLAPPPGVEARRPIDGCVAEWRIQADPGAYLTLRVHQPIAPDRKHPGRAPYVEIRTGVASFGPDLSDPAHLRRFGRLVNASCQSLADALKPAVPGPPTLFDVGVSGG